MHHQLLLLIALLFELATAVTSCHYYIIDAKHGRSLVAGDAYDGRVYHQDPTGRANAKWELLPLNGSDSGYYLIEEIRKLEKVWAKYNRV